MPRPLEFNEAMGSLEAHLEIMKNRVDSAKAEYDRSVAKGIQAQIDSAKNVWEQREQEYNDFMMGNMNESEFEDTEESATVH